MAQWIALWTAIALFFAVLGPVRRLPGGALPISWSGSLAKYLPFFWLWSLLSLPVMALSRGRPIFGTHRGRNLLVHLAVSIAVSLVHLALFEALRSLRLSWLGINAPFGERLMMSVRNQLDLNVIVYWAVVVGQHLRRSVSANRERDVAAAQLREQLARAELGALRMQLHPHFLFNALNSVSALIHRDPEQAESMIVHLSRLLRRAFEHRDLQEVPLSREIELARNYLEIAVLRHGERLRYDVDVPPALSDAMVPAFLLQPVAENAVVHGIETDDAGGWIVVRARQQGASLRLEVENSVPAEPSARRQRGSGVGVENVRARLRHLYGEAATFELDVQFGSRALARIVLPYREESVRMPRTGPSANKETA